MTAGNRRTGNWPTGKPATGKHIVFFCFIIASCWTSCGPDFTAKKSYFGDLVQNGAVGPASEDLPAEDALRIVVFDVGEGDAALVVAPDGAAALIDTGPPGNWDKKIAPYLSVNDDIDLKYLFISHNDSDHNGDAQQTGLIPVDVMAGDVFYIGDDVWLDIIVKDCAFKDGEAIQCDQNDDNAHSAAMLIGYGSFRYLTAGDLPGGGGNPPYDTIDMETKVGELAGDVDVLHAGHHGSNTSTNANFLESTAPETVIISAGNGNDYWHPHQSVIERLLDFDTEVYLTERGWLKDEFLDIVNVANGDILIESDGISFEIGGL